MNGLHLVLVDVEVDVGLDEEDVVNCCKISPLAWSPDSGWEAVQSLTLVLAPFAIARSLVVDSGQEAEVLKGDLLLLDAELVFQLALSGTLRSSDGVDQVCASLGGNAQRVRAAGVGPHVWEGNLLRGALLKQ